MTCRPDFIPLSYGSLHWTGDVPAEALDCVNAHHVIAAIASMSVRALKLNGDIRNKIKSFVKYAADDF